MKKILFLCTGNSCRSQMAEGWANFYKGNEAKFYSAGTKKHGMNPYAIRVMKEAGVSLDDHYSKTLEELAPASFDLVVTVCSDADENCPFIPGARVVHHGFDDPPRLAGKMNSEEEVLKIYKRVRDEIKDFVRNNEFF